MSKQAQLLALWAVCSLIAAAMAVQFTSATYEEHTGEWVPASNDSFYHARRILDAAETDIGFYQFDDKMHVPEGSWINWPWGYDWSMAKALQAWKWINPDADSMFFLTHVAVYWIFVNAALLIGICVALELATPWTAMVMLGFAVSPLTMMLHGVGVIDHHYIEYTFVLLTVLTGVLWFKHPNRTLYAVLLGIALGFAPAFHTGLFILQAPVLLTLAILWLRGSPPPSNALLALSSSLILTTLAALIPSEPFRDGQFQFAVLSWFHLYIAAVSTLLIACCARFKYSKTSLVALSTLAIVLLIPIWKDTIGGAAFLSGKIVLLDQVSEAKNPFRMADEDGGIQVVLSYYSLFILIAPLLVPIYLWRGWHTRDAAKLFFAVMTVFGVTLLFTQFRLHYFGSFALILGWAVLANEKLSIAQRKPWLTFAAALVVITGAFYYGVKGRAENNYALGLDPGYQDNFTAFAALAEACERNPGTVLADNNFGHYVRYHTKCSVIANNFLMTPLHEKKIIEMQTLLKLSPEELIATAPQVRYVFSRLIKYYGKRDDGRMAFTTKGFLERVNEPLFYQLNSRDDLPARIKVIRELPLDADRGLVRTRIVEILPEDSIPQDTTSPPADTDSDASDTQETNDN